MWTARFLDPEDSTQNVSFWFVSGKTYSVGRKECDILVNDKSVSRKHAQIIVDLPKIKGNLKTIPQLKISDVSKFGTLVNNTKCSNGEMVILKPGDKVIFGTNLTKCYEFDLTPLKFCISNVSGDSSSLKLLIEQIGELVDQVGACTHLVMDEIKVTSKVLLALIQIKPIVNINWLKEIVQRKVPSDPLPDVKNYLPKLGQAIEIDLSLFHVNNKRKNLFLGKTFVFLVSEQYEKIFQIIKEGSGNVVKSFGEEGEEDIETFFQIHKHSCIVAPETLKLNTRTKQKIKKMYQLQFQLIKEDDIGLAILHADSSQLVPAGEESLPNSNSLPKVISEKQEKTEEDSSLEIVNPSKQPRIHNTSPTYITTTKKEEKSPNLSSPSEIKKISPIHPVQQDNSLNRKRKKEETKNLDPFSIETLPDLNQENEHPQPEEKLLLTKEMELIASPNKLHLSQEGISKNVKTFKKISPTKPKNKKIIDVVVEVDTKES